MATASAILWPGRMWPATARFENEAPAPLHAVGLRRPVRDEVDPDLAPRALDPRVGLALRELHLADRLDPGARRDRPRRQPVQRLADDADRLPELLHPHAVARVAVRRRLHRHVELELLVRGVGLHAADVVGEPRAPEERAGDAHLLRQLAGDHAHALGAHQEDRVPLEEGLVLAEPPLDVGDRLAALVRPARRGCRSASRPPGGTRRGAAPPSAPRRGRGSSRARGSSRGTSSPRPRAPRPCPCTRCRARGSGRRRAGAPPPGPGGTGPASAPRSGRAARPRARSRARRSSPRRSPSSRRSTGTGRRSASRRASRGSGGGSRSPGRRRRSSPPRA